MCTTGHCFTSYSKEKGPFEVSPSVSSVRIEPVVREIDRIRGSLKVPSEYILGSMKVMFLFISKRTQHYKILALYLYRNFQNPVGKLQTQKEKSCLPIGPSLSTLECVISLICMA